MLRNLNKLEISFPLKGGGGSGFNLKVLNRTPSLVIPPFEGLRKRKQMVWSRNVYDHSIINGGLKCSEILQCYKKSEINV